MKIDMIDMIDTVILGYMLVTCLHARVHGTSSVSSADMGGTYNFV